jgi:hypothetical protein
MSHRSAAFYVNELNDPGGTVECVGGSGVNVAAMHLKPGAIPATAFEREALRVAGGGSDHEGTGLVPSPNYHGSLQSGWDHRYGFTGDHISEWADLFAAVQHEGKWAVVRGDYNRLPDRYTFQVRDDFSHAMAVGANDGMTWWVVDPLDPRHAGQAIPISVMRTFCATSGYDALTLPEYVAPNHGHISVRGEMLNTYTVRLGVIVGYRNRSGLRFDADTTLAAYKWYPAHGRRVRVAKILNGAHVGWWVGVTGHDYTEEP